MHHKSKCVFGIWFAAVIVLGGILTSYHQPFQSPDKNVLELAGPPIASGWRAIHILSAGCGCSLRVMQHLLARPPLDGATEQIVLIDGNGPSLAGSEELLKRLKAKGFRITHRLAKDIPPALGLRGVPLLVVATPENKLVYSGGYGSHEDQDVQVFRQVRTGLSTASIPVLGCAIGSQLRRSADPFRFKY
jgi:hypothetical protein